MKKIFLAVFVLTLITAMNSCGSGGESKDGNKDTSTVQDPAVKKTDNPDAGLSDNPDYQAGLGLIAKSNCLTCHKVDEPLIGPTYRDVANKYAPANAAMIDSLALKIIHGGNGVWGQIPMTPHPEVSINDARAMVKYVLLLKK